MSIFRLYLELGVSHIADLGAYDHILFITALCAVYTLRQWKKVLILVTAFTLGHSLTLALASLQLVRISTALVEFLIPLTIFMTAGWNVLQPGDKVAGSSRRFKYAAALFFGLIHGLGFSNYLRSLLGQEERIVTPLFAFNVGLEMGQILIVLTVLLLSALLTVVFGVGRRDWNMVVSGGITGISLILLIERIP